MLENVENCVRTKNSFGFSLTETEVPLLDEAASQKVIHGEDVEEPGRKNGRGARERWKDRRQVDEWKEDKGRRGSC